MAYGCNTSKESTSTTISIITAATTTTTTTVTTCITIITISCSGSSNVTVVRALHHKLSGCRFDSNLNLCLWDLFPITVTPQPYNTGVTGVKAKQLNY